MKDSGTEWSEIEIDFVQKASRLISCKSVKPLKILNPGSATAAYIVLSNYGGGMVSGDVVKIELKAHSLSKFFLTTQSNSRAFKSEKMVASEQHIHGTIGENALGIYVPDPLVPHEKSLSLQKQEWQLEQNSALFIIDWFTSGRTESGEQFLYTHFASEVSIFLNKKLLLHDKFSFSPETSDAQSPGNFGKYHHFINGYLAGDENNNAFKLIKNFLLSFNQDKDSAIENNSTGDDKCIIVSDHVKPGLVSLRILGKRRLDIQDFFKSLGKVLEVKNLLGFNYMERKL